MKQDFENFLKEKHAEDYIGTDDDMPDDFENWLGGQSAEELIGFADEWTEKVVSFARLRVGQIKGVYSAHDALKEVDELLADLLRI